MHLTCLHFFNSSQKFLVSKQYDSDEIKFSVASRLGQNCLMKYPLKAGKQTRVRFNCKILFLIIKTNVVFTQKKHLDGSSKHSKLI